MGFTSGSKDRGQIGIGQSDQPVKAWKSESETGSRKSDIGSKKIDTDTRDQNKRYINEKDLLDLFQSSEVWKCKCPIEPNADFTLNAVSAKAEKIPLKSKLRFTQIFRAPF